VKAEIDNKNKVKKAVKMLKLTEYREFAKAGKRIKAHIIGNIATSDYVVISQRCNKAYTHGFDSMRLVLNRLLRKGWLEVK
jgi:hypothetical protein